MDTYSDTVHRTTSPDINHEAHILYDSESDPRSHAPYQGTENESYMPHFTSPGKTQELLAYIFFFILGASFLLPWNSMLVSTTYFGSRLAGHRFQFNYMNWITVVFTIANVIFVSRATSTQQYIVCCPLIQPHKKGGLF